MKTKSKNENESSMPGVMNREQTSYYDHLMRK